MTNEVASIKVLWRNQFVEQGNWEAEEDMKKNPHLFESGKIPNQSYNSFLCNSSIDMLSVLNCMLGV